MKSSIKIKITALALCLSMAMGVCAFAAENKAAEAEVQKITYEEAVEMAIKNSSSFATLSDNIKLAEKNREQLSQSLSFTLPPNAPVSLVIEESSYYNGLSQLKSLQATLDNKKYNTQILKSAVEKTVLEAFNNIYITEINLINAEKSLELKAPSEEWNQLKYRLGMISKNALESATVAYNDAKSDLEKIKLNRDLCYVDLKSFLGISSDKKISIDFSPEYVKIDEIKNLEAEINRRISVAPNIKLAESSAEMADFLMSYYVMGESYTAKENSQNAANRSLKDIKKAFFVALNNTYTSIISYEKDIADAKAEIAAMETSYASSVISFENGTLTKYALDGLAFNIQGKKNALDTLIAKHSILLFTFNNPSVLFA